MKKTISIFIPSLRGNGAENVCVTVSNYLANNGYEIDIVILNNNKTDILDRLDKSINILNLNCSLRFSFLKIPKYIKKRKPQIIISFSHIFTTQLTLAKIFCHKFVLITRCMNTLSIQITYNNNLYSKINYILSVILFRYSNKVIAQCQGMNNDLIKAYKISPKKIITINNPIRKEIFYSIPQQLNYPYKFILCVGRLNRQKAFDNAIKCFAKLSKHHNNLKLIIVGRGEEQQNLEKIIKDLKLQSKVELKGYTNCIVDLYYNAAFTLLTSNYEGFPNVLLESIAVGTPIVAYNCPSGPSEIIIENINGFLVKERNDNKLIATMEKALYHQWDRDKIRETANKYSPEKILPQYKLLIEETLKTDMQ